MYLKGQTLSPAKKPGYLELVSLQKAAGYWDLETKLLDVFGLAKEELVKQMPAQVCQS